MKKIYVLFFFVLSSVVISVGQVRPRVFINPGHGGHDSNDRPSFFYNIGAGDTLRYYESDTNLAKGLALRDILEQRGYEVRISRTGNTSADDLDLFEISALANHSGADLFFSIHSNATGVVRRVNYTLALYRGWNGQPCVEGSDSIAASMIRSLDRNRITTWTHPKMKAGDWSFFRGWGYKTGLGVLRYNKLPGMLVEGEFHDYFPEKCRLMNADYCWLEGWNQSLSIDEYFGRTAKRGVGAIAGRLLDLTAESVYPGEILFGLDSFRPLNATAVTLETPDGHVVASTVTDNRDNGVYVFKNVPAGRYRVCVRDTVRDVILLPATTAYCNFSFD